MPDPTARLNAALEGRYSIERGLGEGRVAVALRATSRSWFIFSVQGGDPDAEGDATTPMRLILVQNFFEELKRLVPAN